jgi:hypothetical protein
LLFLLGIGPFGLLLTEYRGTVDAHIVVFSLCALGFAIGNLLAMADARTVHIKIVANFALLALLATVLLFPALNTYKGAGDFCRPVRELALSQQEMRLYSIAFSREEYVFYSRHFHQDRFIDPLPVRAAPELDEMTSAKLQRKIRNAITKAVDGVEVSSLSAPTDADLTALQGAVEKAIAEPTVDPGFARAFRGALTEAVHYFAAEFTQPGPAFAYVQEQDWKWLLPLLPQRKQFVVIAQEGVGKRTMLLLANETAVERVQTSSPASPG